MASFTKGVSSLRNASPRAGVMSVPSVARARGIGSLARFREAVAAPGLTLRWPVASSSSSGAPRQQQQQQQRLLTTASVAARPVSQAPSPRALDPAQAPREAHGFVLERSQFVREYDAHVLLYRHAKTGAELISVLNGDENKTFGVVFRTPVDDSTGIPHILEHSVLCGSRKYPIKEPFVELMKGSLNTFLNAFTYPDRTCYPVASTNVTDFYNLVDVYLDAVFHPRCITDPQVFAQEGWHYELEDEKEGEMSYKGVVFNEMKGVYSNPDSVFGRAVQQALFPDNTYRHDSGGDPAAIPKLTFDDFKAFHGRYYHPSNARFWFYGDDAPVRRLALLDAYLSEFDARPVDSAVATQPLLKAPRTVTEYYASGEEAEGGEEGGKAYVAVNWVLSDAPLSVETELALGFLDYLMMGTSASPLRKALNDSGLGAAVIGGGMDDELKQPVFSVGLKGVAPDKMDAVEALVLAKLTELSSTPFSASAVEAAVNTIEFSLRENNTGSFPRGLSLMLRAAGAWIYDRDPLVPLQWEEALGALKARLAAGEDVFTPLIRQYLLTNSHRVTVRLLPDPALGAKMEGREKAELEAVRAGMKPDDVAATVSATEALKAKQETPDPPEALSCVPTLHLSDIPRSITKVPTAVVATSSGATLLGHDLFTNNVLYLEAAFDMSSLPARLLPLVPLFCRSLTQMGTAKESFVELTERIGRKTGGLSVSPFTTASRAAGGAAGAPVSYLLVRGKAMGSKAGDMLELMRDVLTTARLDDKARFSQMVAETKAGLESGIVGSGHSFAAKRIAAQRSTASWASEQMGGLSYLTYVRGLAKKLEAADGWDAVKADLEEIRSRLLQQKGAYVNMTADGSTLSGARRHVDDFLASLPATSSKAAASSNEPGWAGSLLPSSNEALTVPTQVSYVGKGANLYADAGYSLSGSAYVVEKYLGTTWLWDRVRVVGGAYGGFCSFDPHSGQFVYLSYRDPNLLATLDVYDGSPAFLRGLELSKEELTKAIIGTIGDVDAYQLPDAKGYAAFTRHLLGITDEERQMRREQILGTSVKDFHAFGDVLAAVAGPAGRVVAVTSADKAAAALQERPGFWTVNKVL